MPQTKPTQAQLDKLTSEQYRVTQEKGTELPGSGEYEKHWDKGTYHCVVCGHPLFESDTKFDAHCGWPSFSAPKDKKVVEESLDTSHDMRRTEVTCSHCGAHLGHVFPDYPKQGKDWYCINSASLQFNKQAS